MKLSRRHDLVGKHVLVIFKTTHFDRAGETGSEVGRHGEVVAVQAGWVIVAATDGSRFRVPLSNLYAAPPATHPSKRRRQTDYLAAEELVRDFHSAAKPLTLRWLKRAEAVKLYEALRSS